MTLDLNELQDIEMLVGSLYNFVQRKVAIRFGIVPSLKSAAAVDQAKIVYHLLDTYGLSAVITYLQAVCTPEKAKITMAFLTNNSLSEAGKRWAPIKPILSRP